MVRANSTCFGVRLPPTLSASRRARIKQAVERRAQLVRHVREKLGFVPGRQGQLLGLLFQRRARLLDLAVLELDLVHLLRELARLLLQLLVRRAQLVLLGLEQRLRLLQVERLLLEAVVGFLELLLLTLQLGRQRLRLVQEIFRLHVRRDGMQHDADRFGELVEEGLVDLAELGERGQLDDRFHLALEQHRQDDDARRRARAERRADADVVARRLREQDPLLLERALPDQALAEGDLARQGLALALRVAREQLELRVAGAVVRDVERGLLRVNQGGQFTQDQSGNRD